MYLRNISVPVYLLWRAQYAWFRAIANYKQLPIINNCQL